MMLLVTFLILCFTLYCTALNCARYGKITLDYSNLSPIVPNANVNRIYESPTRFSSGKVVADLAEPMMADNPIFALWDFGDRQKVNVLRCTSPDCSSSANMTSIDLPCSPSCVTVTPRLNGNTIVNGISAVRSSANTMLIFVIYHPESSGNFSAPRRLLKSDCTINGNASPTCTAFNEITANVTSAYSRDIAKPVALVLPSKSVGFGWIESPDVFHWNVCKDKTCTTFDTTKFQPAPEKTLSMFMIAKVFNNQLVFAYLRASTNCISSLAYSNLDYMVCEDEACVTRNVTNLDTNLNGECRSASGTPSLSLTRRIENGVELPTITYQDSAQSIADGNATVVLFCDNVECSKFDWKAAKQLGMANTTCSEFTMVETCVGENIAFMGEVEGRVFIQQCVDKRCNEVTKARNITDIATPSSLRLDPDLFHTYCVDGTTYLHWEGNVDNYERMFVANISAGILPAGAALPTAAPTPPPTPVPTNAPCDSKCTALSPRARCINNVCVCAAPYAGDVATGCSQCASPERYGDKCTSRCAGLKYVDNKPVCCDGVGEFAGSTITSNGTCTCPDNLDPSNGCTLCKQGFFRLSSEACRPCDCPDSAGVRGCDPKTGACLCHQSCPNGYFDTATKCATCQEGYFGPKCDKSCQCARSEHRTLSCNDGISGDGKCTCRGGWGGIHCNDCVQPPCTPEPIITGVRPSTCSCPGQCASGGHVIIPRGCSRMCGSLCCGSPIPERCVCNKGCRAPAPAPRPIPPPLPTCVIVPTPPPPPPTPAQTPFSFSPFTFTPFTFETFTQPDLPAVFVCGGKPLAANDPQAFQLLTAILKCLSPQCQMDTMTDNPTEEACPCFDELETCLRVENPTCQLATTFTDVCVQANCPSCPGGAVVFTPNPTPPAPTTAVRFVTDTNGGLVLDANGKPLTEVLTQPTTVVVASSALRLASSLLMLLFMALANVFQ